MATAQAQVIKHTEEFTIRTAYLEAAKEHVEKLARKAKKVGVGQPTLTIGEEKLRKHYPDSWDLQEFWYESYTEVTLTWEEIKLEGGWQFVATAEAVEGVGNLICGVPDLVGKLPHDLRTRKLTCEHCKTMRNRKKHYILMDMLGQNRIVGSSCINDFLGVDATGKLNILESEWGLVRGMETDEFWGDLGGSIILEASLRRVVVTTIAVLNFTQWVKRADSDILAGKRPTFDTVQNQIFNHKLKEDERFPITSDDIAKAEIILQRWQATADKANEYSSEWDWKKKLFMARPSVELKNMSTVVGMTYGEILVIQRETEQQAKREAQGVSEFFGTVGKRETFTLTITKTSIMETEWGISDMVIGLQNNTSNKFVWYNSGDQSWYEEGQTYQVKATVKSHDDNPKWGRQTKLTRVSPV